MKWSFTVPGVPPSTNHLYVRVRGNWNKMAKAPGVERYQTAVTLLTKVAKPTDWEPRGQIRVMFDFFLTRDADCDNLQKAALDAVALGLGINDRVVLPCVRSKTVSKDLTPHTDISIWNLADEL